MPIDPNIPLVSHAPEGPNVLQMLAQVQAIKGGQQEQQLRGLQIQEGQQALEARTRANEDVTALNDALKSNTTVGDDGVAKTDYAGVSRTLAAAGKGQAFLKFQDDMAKTDEQRYKTVTERLTAVRNAGNMVAQDVQLVDDQPSWDAFRTMTKKRLSAISPDLGTLVDQLPAQFSPQAKQVALTAGMSAKELNDHLLAAAADARKAPGEAAESDEKVRRNAAAALGAAKTQADYAKAYAALPEAVAARFPKPETWDAKRTPAAVRQIGETPFQQGTAEYRQREVAVQEGNLQQRQRENDRLAADPRAQDPTLAQDWAEYREYVAHHQFEHEQAVKTGTTTIPKQEESAPQTPVYTPAKSFDDWRKTSGSAARKPGAPSPGVRGKQGASGEPSKPSDEGRKVYVRFPDDPALKEYSGQLVTFRSAADRDAALKVLGMTIAAKK